jgi:type I restriction enzyme M protein
VSENNANLVWSIANLLRGPYKPKEYGEVVLPFTILRRLDCVLEPTKDAVLAAYEAKKDGQFPLSVVLPRVSKQSFYNTSRYSLTKLGDADHIKANLLDYLNGFSENVRDIFERFGFLNQIERLDENELLLLVTRQFAAVDLHPKKVSNIAMGLLFEELIRKFAESSNETAGEHFTPREVIKLMVELLFIADDDALAKPDTRRSIYDPAAGTGGMLSVADEHLRHLNPDAKLSMAGQEINPSSYAVCKADMVIKGQPIDAIVLGDTLINDGHRGKHFNYCLSNPPFGVEWKKAEKAVREEYEQMGYNGPDGLQRALRSWPAVGQ